MESLITLNKRAGMLASPAGCCSLRPLVINSRITVKRLIKPTSSANFAEEPQSRSKGPTRSSGGFGRSCRSCLQHRDLRLKLKVVAFVDVGQSLSDASAGRVLATPEKAAKKKRVQ